MAKRVVLIDDLTGKEGTDVESREFYNPFTGKPVSLDLSAKSNEHVIDLLAKTFEKAVAVAYKPGQTVSNGDNGEAAAIRKWAKGEEKWASVVADRGRIPEEVKAAWNAARAASKASTEDQPDAAKVEVPSTAQKVNNSK